MAYVLNGTSLATSLSAQCLGSIIHAARYYLGGNFLFNTFTLGLLLGR